jgi:hypothetical protein
MNAGPTFDSAFFPAWGFGSKDRQSSPELSKTTREGITCERKPWRSQAYGVVSSHVSLKNRQR